MAKTFQIINPRVGFNHGQRHWIGLGQPLSVGKQRHYRLMCDRQDGQYQAVFAEEISGHLMRNHLIEDGHWLHEYVPTGHLEIIPKVLRYDNEGRVDAVLVDLLHTPAELPFIQF